MSCDHDAGSGTGRGDAANDPTPMVMGNHSRGRLRAAGRNRRFDVRFGNDTIGFELFLAHVHVDLIRPFVLRDLKTASCRTTGGIRLHRHTIRTAERCKWTAASTIVYGEEHERTGHRLVILIVDFDDGFTRGTRTDVIQRPFSLDDVDEESLRLAGRGSHDLGALCACRARPAEYCGRDQDDQQKLRGFDLGFHCEFTLPEVPIEFASVADTPVMLELGLLNWKVCV